MRQSSLNAYKDVKTRVDLHYDYIKKALLKIGKNATGKVISKHCKELSYHQVMRRLSEMREMGMIKEYGNDYSQKYNPIIWGF